MSISRVYRREHLAPHKKVWVKFSERDEEDDAVIALINEIEYSSEISTHRKAVIQRDFIVDGLKRLHGCESLVELCRRKGLRRSDGAAFSFAGDGIPDDGIMPIKTIVRKTTQYVLKKHNAGDETLSSGGSRRRVRPGQRAIPDGTESAAGATNKYAVQKEPPIEPAIPTEETQPAELSSPVSTQAQPAAPYIVDQPPAEPTPRAKPGNLMWS